MDSALKFRINVGRCQVCSVMSILGGKKDSDESSMWIVRKNAKRKMAAVAHCRSIDLSVR
jgi:hypothetical protein